MKFDQELFNKIKESKAPQKLLIVPAQLTLSAEAAAFEATDAEGFFDLQIMSGNKLRAEILNKTGGPGLTPITSLGRQLILRKCAKEADLDLYKNLRTSADFLSAAGDFIVQSKQTLSDEIEIKEELPELLKKKLSDMTKLRDLYQSYMSGKYIDSEDGLAFATEKVKTSDWIKMSEIWFVGFYSFTKREKEFLKALDENSFGCHVILSAPKEEFPKALQPVISADTAYDEGVMIAAEILRLIREENYKAEDIMILSANVKNDARNFKRIFDSLGIPTYIDEKRSVMHIEAASKIVNLLDMTADGLMAHSVIQFVDDPDFTNYVKSYHIKGKAFLERFKYGGDKKINAEIARDNFANLTSKFFEEFDASKTVREKSTVLYNFLVNDLKMPEKLEEDASLYAKDGFTEVSEELAQAWSVIVEILDQSVELLGDSEISNEAYRDIIKNAFKDVKIGLLPQKTGCIQIGDLYRTKAYNIKALFVSSFNDESVPRNLSSNKILSDDEIESLAKNGIELCKSYDQLNKEDRCMIYEAFEAPSEKLYFSYASTDVNDQEQKPSYLIADLAEAEKGAEIYTLEELVKKLRDFKSDGKDLDETWKAVAKNFSDSPRFEAAKKGLLYKNENEVLHGDAKSVLRPDYVSPSALEKYVLCPYSYFMTYGIKAEEPVDFTIKSTDIGDIHHEILNRLSRYLSSDGKSARDSKSLWQTISDEEIKAFVSKTVDDIKNEDSSGLFTKSFAEEYRIGKVKELALKFAINMVHQLRLGNVDQIETENAFEFTFHGTKIHGKIDRLDRTKLSDKELVKIIDYKSGSKDFKAEMIEKGIDLQLMVYLESATGSGERPVGSFYFNINSPIEKVDIEGLTKAAAEGLKLDGAFVAEVESFATLDKTVNLGEDSSVVHKNKALSKREYEELREAFRTNLSETISHLQAGEIKVRPVRHNDSLISCTYCSYRSICKYDPQVEGYEIRRI